jgi:hypothetical protein
MQGEAEHALRCRPPFKSTLEDPIEEVLLGSLPSSTLERHALLLVAAKIEQSDCSYAVTGDEGISLDMAARQFLTPHDGKIT